VIFGKKYQRYLGVGSGPPFWITEQWQRLRSRLGILPSLLHEGSAHARQVQRGTKKDISTSFALSTDRRDWCQEDHTDRIMTDIQIFWPSRSECLRRREIPTVYLHLFNASLSEGREVYDQVFHLAVQEQYFSVYRDELQQVYSDICEVLVCGLLAETRSRYTNLNQFESFLIFGLNYRGYNPARLPELDKLPGSWKLIENDNG
jgi:hypothetical protein